jgi:hypothetical protein
MYYPKSQLKTNLYTNGGEYILSTTKENYKGYYYETSSGTKYTGKTPQDGSNTLLLLPPPQDRDLYPSNLTLNLNQPITINISPETLPFYPIYDLKYNPPQLPNIRSLPQSNPTKPTQQDQNLGVFQRYFCKKNNELKYLEIDKSTHDKLKSKQQDIAWDLYTPISTLWYIKGNKEQTFKANKGLVTLIEQKQNWYGFTQWFQDKFLQYYLES